MSKKDVIWELEPHTTAKHAVLKAYLNAWFPILSSWNGNSPISTDLQDLGNTSVAKLVPH